MFYIPTRLLARVIEPALEALGRTLDGDNENGTGAIRVVSDRAMKTLGDVGEEAMLRRLWAIRNEESMRTHTEIADALLLALDISITQDTDLPTLPGCLSGAREMIEVWGDGTEGIEFARKMLHFCSGFTKGLHTDAEDLVPAEEPETELVAA